MKITLAWLKEQKACSDGRTWFKHQKETDGLKLVNTLKVADLSWAN